MCRSMLHVRECTSHQKEYMCSTSSLLLLLQCLRPVKPVKARSYIKCYHVFFFIVIVGKHCCYQGTSMYPSRCPVLINMTRTCVVYNLRLSPYLLHLHTILGSLLPFYAFYICILSILGLHQYICIPACKYFQFVTFPSTLVLPPPCFPCDGPTHSIFHTKVLPNGNKLIQ